MPSMSQLRVALSVVMDVISSIFRQDQIVNSNALEPAKKAADLVKGGSIWRGNGANAFVADVESKLVPNLQLNSLHITTAASNLTRATEIMKQADTQAKSIANNLNDRFKAIY